MQPNRRHIRAVTGLALVSAALVFGVPAVAQDDSLPPLPELPPVSGPTTQAPVSQVDVSALPPEYRSLPVAQEQATTTIGADGVETVTRTRRIITSAPVQQNYTPQGQYQQGYAPAAYPAPGYTPAYAPVVFEREQWLDECNRRTNGRDERDKGGIIGGLLGAIGGGIIGNRISDNERLGGTLIGAGVGGLAGLLLGNLIGGGKKNDRYDCEAALDGYLTQYGTNGPRFASRTIATPAAYPAYGYDYAPVQVYYAQPQQMVMVPMQYQQQQRVIVRETVREEVIPGAVRYIPPAPQRLPSPKLIKN